MKIKVSGTKYKVAVLGNMSNEMTSSFESNLKAVGNVRDAYAKTK